jgi:hypothetical protein
MADSEVLYPDVGGDVAGVKTESWSVLLLVGEVIPPRLGVVEAESDMSDEESESGVCSPCFLFTGWDGDRRKRELRTIVPVDSRGRDGCD